MFKFLLLPFILLFLYAPVTAQDWYASLQSGNIHVYVTNYDSSRIIVTDFPSPVLGHPSLDPSDSVIAKSVSSIFGGHSGASEAFQLLGFSDDVYGNWLKRKRPDGIVTGFHRHFGSKNDTVVQFLALRPAKDTLLDFSAEFGFTCSSFRFLDTTIYGKELHGFSYTHISSNNKFTIIVAKPIGIIRIIDQRSTDEWYLSSAVIGTERFNRDKQPRKAPKICSDFELQYTNTIEDQHYTYIETFSLHDTTINNSQYMFIASNKTSYKFWPFYEYGSWNSAIFGYLSDTLIQYNDTGNRILEERPVSLGDIITSYDMLQYQPDFIPIVVDTGSIHINGIRKRYFRCATWMLDNFMSTQWVDDIGIYNRTNWSYGDGRTISQLTSAIICGEHFIITGMDNPAEVAPGAPLLEADLYPNPVSTLRGTMTLRFAHPVTQPLRIVVCDALGRTVYTSTTPSTLQQEIQIPISRFAPGMYLLSASAGQYRTTKLFYILN